MRLLLRHLVGTVLCVSLAACGPGSPSTNPTDDGGVSDGGTASGTDSDGGTTDGGTDPDGGSTDGGSTDGGTDPDGGTDGGSTDGGSTDGGVDPDPTTPPAPTTCAGAPPIDDPTCEVQSGNDFLWIRGRILTPDGEVRGGEVLVDDAGRIACVGCDCHGDARAAAATRIDCPSAVVSPGLINAHDHITFTGAPPAPTQERYDHRHDWRKGKRGHTKISVASTPNAVGWGELRQVLAGTTSLLGSGGTPGLLRNLDGTGTGTGGQEGLGLPAVKYDTFPLGDSAGNQLSQGCVYPSVFDTARLQTGQSYAPHVAEGIDTEARNEFVCLSGGTGAVEDVCLPRTALIHGVGLRPADYARMALTGTALVWSPRSNVSLYGQTAPVTVADRLGVQIALGSDWTASGSAHLLRELACADLLDRDYLGGRFGAYRLWRMVTVDAADALGVGQKIGSLAVGQQADLVLFAGGTQADGYRAVIEAEQSGVRLVMRGGKVLSGDAVLVDPMGQRWADSRCELLDVCGTPKRVCAARETGLSVAGLQQKAGAAYPLMFCGTPANEPSCVPQRPDSYSGQSRTEDVDGDGVENSVDLCPAVFDPPRPVDANRQSDVDGDGLGDACDPCPVVAGSGACRVDPSQDPDADGIVSTSDNCPWTANSNQADADGDGKGDACDTCPQDSNPGTDPCPAHLDGWSEAEVLAPQGRSTTLRLGLDGATLTDVTVSLTVSDATLQVAPSAVIPTGGRWADVAVVPTASLPDPVILTAALRGRTATATVWTYDAAAARRVRRIEVPAALRVAESASVRIVLDGPLATATDLLVEAQPAGIVLVSPAAQQVSASSWVSTVTLTGQAEGTVTLSARLGTSTALTSSAVRIDAMPPPRAPAAGELRITELLANPSATPEEKFEWIEVQNVSTAPLLLDGLQVTDNGGTPVSVRPVASPWVLDPGAVAVLAYLSDPARNGGVPAAAAYGPASSGAPQILLSNNSDVVELSLGGQSITRVSYGGTLAGLNGRSICLRAGRVGNRSDDWGTGTGTWGGGTDQGSPGQPSTDQNCPP